LDAVWSLFDGTTLLAVALKTAGSLAVLLAAGSALVPALPASRAPRVDLATRRLAVAAALIGLGITVLQVLVRASFLGGGGVRAAFDPVLLGLVLDSPFGLSSLVRGAGLVLLLALAVARPAARLGAAVGAVLACLSFTLVGHTLEAPRLLLGGLLLVHVLGIAFWVGVFCPLHRLAGVGPAAAAPLAAAFSRVATVVVAAVLAAGGTLLWLLAGPPWDLLASDYGRLMAVKLALVAGLLGLALWNRRRLTPRLSLGDTGAAARAAARLRASIRLEAALVVAILAVTAAFTTLASP
jgi:putative copper resistance protein D